MIVERKKTGSPCTKIGHGQHLNTGLDEPLAVRHTTRVRNIALEPDTANQTG